MTVEKKKTVKRVVGKAIVYFFLVLIAVILLFPYGFMLNRGLMSNERVLDAHMYYWTDGRILSITCARSATAATVCRS